MCARVCVSVWNTVEVDVRWFIVIVRCDFLSCCKNSKWQWMQKMHTRSRFSEHTKIVHWIVRVSCTESSMFKLRPAIFVMEMCDVFMCVVMHNALRGWKPSKSVCNLTIIQMSTNLSCDLVVLRRWRLAWYRSGSVPATACPIHCPSCYDPANKKYIYSYFVKSMSTCGYIFVSDT